MEEQKLVKKKKKAQRDNNDEALINICTDLANLYVERAQFEFAIEEFTIVANIYQKKNQQLEYATAHRGIGEAYLGLHNFVEALKHQTTYLNIARELKNKPEEQRALATIGHIYLSSFLNAVNGDRSNLDLANKFLRKSLVLAQSLNGQVSKLEIADMSARLFSNLGLVQDCMGNFDNASELITKSITLCKANDLYEQLQRGYMSLASLLNKKGDHKSALQQYNLAAEAAKNLRNKSSLLTGILLSKSEILVKLGDLQGAKNALFKAYKLKTPDVKDRKTIENNLRVVAAMCYNENTLLSTDSTDYTKLKTLYEKMGDGACDLRQFDKALDYYKKMLDSATKANLPDPDLASCYYSLAETYKDNGQFEAAVVYFEQELELCRCLKDSLNTLSKIADTKETGDADISDVKKVYNRAIELCQKENNIHEEGRMLKRFIGYLRREKQHSEAFLLEQKLSKLDFHSTDTDGESSEAPTASVLGGDIDLDKITDVSDDSDLELERTPKPRRRTKNYQIRKNIKGETQLHTACIKGQLNVVNQLIAQGHPINVRDNAGWLPLHEACIKGHREIVELLLEKGASINDRGGTQCEGITPLHDAASNGHLDVIQLLLNKGANAVAKTDTGDTVLDFLKTWRLKNELDDDNQRLYESIIEEIGRDLEKSGHVSASGRDVEMTTPTKDMRRSAIIGLEDDDSVSPPQPSAHDYRDVMENLRHRNNSRGRRATVTKRPALLGDDDVTDDWLEDDIGKSTKKRKTNSPTKKKTNSPTKRSSNSPTKRKSNSPTKRKTNSPVKSLKSKKSFDEGNPLKSQTSRNSFDWNRTKSSEDFAMLTDDELFEEPETLRRQISPKSQPSTSRKFVRKRQTKLTNFGHTRNMAEADSTSSPVNIVEKSPKKCRRVRSFDNKTQPVMEPTLSVDVRINKKLYRVPVLLSQVRTQTIKWLAGEAAARYARKEYMIPTLELETKNGAILADDDPISLLFPMGATQAEEVEARIIKQSIPPIIDRFKEACQAMSIVPDEEICRVLQEFSITLDLSNRGLKGPTLAPLCKILNRQTNLLELDLSGNFLTNDCFKFLGATMPSLENLCKLNLNCTSLQSEHVQTLIDNLSPDVSYRLIDLNLSDNFIGDQSWESLALLTRRFQLRKLNLSGNKFTKNLFERFSNKDVTLVLDQLEEFDVSDNELSREALVKFFSWMNLAILKDLNVSRTSVQGKFVAQILSNWGEARRLKICRLSRCQVQDSDVFDLLSIANSLDTLDLSYNDSLTSISLRRILQSDVENVFLYGCENIFQYFTEVAKFVDQTSHEVQKGKTLKLSLPEDRDSRVEYLEKMWRGWYGSRAAVELSSRFLSLSLK